MRPQVRFQRLRSRNLSEWELVLGPLVIAVSPAPFSKWNLPNQRLQKSSRSLLTSSLPLQGIEINSQITSLLPLLIKQTNKKLVGSVRKEALDKVKDIDCISTWIFYFH